MSSQPNQNFSVKATHPAIDLRPSSSVSKNVVNPISQPIQNKSTPATVIRSTEGLIYDRA